MKPVIQMLSFYMEKAKWVRPAQMCARDFFFFFCVRLHVKEVTDKPHNHEQLCSSRAVFASLSQLSPCCFQQQQAAVSGEKALKKSLYATCSAPNSRQRHNTSRLLGDSVCSVVSPSTAVSRTPEKDIVCSKHSVSNVVCENIRMSCCIRLHFAVCG